MKKITTATGYIAYEATKAEIQLLGGYGICFESWSKTARYYPEDIPIQDRRAAYYERMIPLTNQI